MHSHAERGNEWDYEPKKYICFLVQSPKLREVFASDFRDFDNSAEKFSFKGDFSLHKKAPNKSLLHTDISKGLPMGVMLIN